MSNRKDFYIENGVLKYNMISLLNQIAENRGNTNDICKMKNAYNIFHVLEIEHREVLICRFIGNLLDPRGSHGMGILPLEIFINDVIGDKDISEKELNSAVIILEEPIDSDRRVDIVIHLKKKLYPIEVKIWAGDQDCQLQDYFKYYFENDKSAYKDNKNKKIYYLTPSGWSPSKSSQGNLEEDNIMCLSFEKNISEWIKKIESSCNSEVQFVIKNFMEVINKMCVNSKETDAILNALSIKEESYKKSDRIDSAIILLKHSDEIWSEIRRKYLFSKLDCGDDYQFDNCSDSDKEVDRHILFKIIKKSDDKKTVAWICVETNLYIVTRKNCEGSSEDGWHDYQNGNYQWRYIKPKGYKGKTFALNKPTTDLPDEEIDIKNILDEIAII